MRVPASLRLRARRRREHRGGDIAEAGNRARRGAAQGQGGHKPGGLGVYGDGVGACRRDEAAASCPPAPALPGPHPAQA